MKKGFTNKSSSRKLRSAGLRDIKSFSSGLYPALQTCGVTRPGVRGFTLIELLVVVLIIGILSAIALPQYQKAVWKSRLTEIPIYLKHMQNALDLYLLENGNPSASFGSNNNREAFGLDELFPSGEHRSKYVSYYGSCSSDGSCDIEADWDETEGEFVLRYTRSSSGVWTKSCVMNTSDFAGKLCTSLKY